ncbi:MAG: GatB/YqeY domain-containing protein [Pseudomonadota bacterium]
MLRDQLTKSLKAADASEDQNRLATLRLICAAIKDRDAALTGDASAEGVSDTEILPILERMIEQREEAARDCEEAGRLGLAEQERDEARVIEEFLPTQMSDAQMEAAIDATMSEVGAESIRDLGRIMGTLKDRYPGQLDFCKAGTAVKTRLCNRASA